MSYLHRDLAAGFIQLSSIEKSTTLTRRQQTGKGIETREETRTSMEWQALPGRKVPGKGGKLTDTKISVSMSPSHLSVYMALILHTTTPLDEEEFTSTASIPMLTQTCGWSMRQVSDILADLCAVGWISRVTRGQTSSKTTIFREPNQNRVIQHEPESALVGSQEAEPVGIEPPAKSKKSFPVELRKDKRPAALTELLRKATGKQVTFGSLSGTAKDEVDLVTYVEAVLFRGADPSTAKLIKDADSPAAALASKLTDICKQGKQYAAWMRTVQPQIDYHFTNPTEDVRRLSPQEVLGEFLVAVLGDLREGLPNISHQTGFDALCTSLHILLRNKGTAPTFSLCQRVFTARDPKWRNKLIRAENPGEELARQYGAMLTAFPENEVEKVEADVPVISAKFYPDDDDLPSRDSHDYDPDDAAERIMAEREALAYADPE